MSPEPESPYRSCINHNTGGVSKIPPVRRRSFYVGILQDIWNCHKKLEQPEPGCWISAVAPTQEDIDFLTNKIGVLPEFIKSSLDEEESSHIDYDDDENQTLVIVDYPSAEEDDNLDENTLLYTTLPLGVVIMKGYVITISCMRI